VQKLSPDPFWVLLRWLALTALGAVVWLILVAIGFALMLPHL
jgi:hypothetical protein